jgi:hypothetical protein
MAISMTETGKSAGLSVATEWLIDKRLLQL